MFCIICNPFEKFILIVFQSPQMPEVSSTDHLAKFYIGDHVVSSSSLADEYTNSELSSSFLDKSSVRPKRYEEYEFCSKVWIHPLTTSRVICNTQKCLIGCPKFRRFSDPLFFCVLLNERKLVRPSLGILRVIFHVCQASKAHWSGG